MRSSWSAGVYDHNEILLPDYYASSRQKKCTVPVEWGRLKCGVKIVSSNEESVVVPIPEFAGRYE